MVGSTPKINVISAPHTHIKKTYPREGISLITFVTVASMFNFLRAFQVTIPVTTFAIGNGFTTE